MPQATAAWDLRHMTREPSTVTEAYILSLLIVGVIGVVKLLRAWRVSPPFRLSHTTNKPSYLELLQSSANSLTQWIGLTFLGWGIYASRNIYNVCDRLLDQRMIGSSVILIIMEDFSSDLMMGLLTVTFLFAVRWHMFKKIDYLGTLSHEL
jgi:hypothetical protein